MRFKNTKGPLKLYAVAGAKTVLLAFDLSAAKLKNKPFLGFSISRTDANGKNKRLLNGSKYFASLVKDNSITNKKIKFTSLIQSFFWKDYLAQPDTSYIYTVEAMMGTAKKHEAAFTTQIRIATEPLLAGKHSVYFNFGVTGSQGYAKNKTFGNQSIFNLSEANFEKALAYLGRELYAEGVKKFIQQANDKSYSLYCALYEIQYPSVVKELKAISKKCGQLCIVYSAKADQLKDGKHEPGNLNALKADGLDALGIARTKASQPHNKFMILCKNDIPIQVWTGSTNLTYAGLYGHCNTGHWIQDKAIAKKYMAYWQCLSSNPSMNVLNAVSEKIQPNAVLSDLPNGSYVFFSPRNRAQSPQKPAPQIKAYADLINNARELVCMIFPFNFDPAFKAVYNQKRDYLRYLLFEESAQAKNARNKSDADVNLKVTGGAVLKDKVEQFAKEVTAGKTVGAGIQYVHNKFLLIDPLGSKPIVVSGSANFSNSSI